MTFFDTIKGNTNTPPTHHLPHPHITQYLNGDDAIFHRAMHLLKQDKTKQAMKVFSGFGTPKRDKNIASQCARMHPSYGSTSISDPSCTSANAIKSKNALKIITSNACVDTKSFDAIGWAPWLLAPIKTKGPGDINGVCLKIHARFRVIVGNPTNILSPHVFIMTFSVMSPHNKVHADINIALATANKDQKIRPLVQGSSILNDIAKATLMSKPAKEIRNLLPGQYHSIPGGMQTAALTAQAAYDSGCALHSEDQKSAFNLFNRSKICQAADFLFPSGAPTIKKFHSIGSPIVLSFVNSDNSHAVLVFFSHEGVRQGCGFSSFSFNLGAQFHIYNPLMSAFPETDSIIATDDFTSVVPCPPSSDPDAWEQWYDRRAEYTAKFRSLAASANAELVADKSVILLPSHAPLPRNPTRANGTVLNCTHAGLVLCGIPIGSQEFRTETLAVNACATTTKVDNLAKFAEPAPRRFLSFMTNSSNVSLDYVSSCLPSVISCPILEIVDSHIWSAVKLALSAPPTSSYSTQRDDRASRIAHLPVIDGGLGLIPMVRKSPGLFLTTIMSSVGDPLFDKYSKSLLPSIKSTYTSLCNSLDCANITTSHPLALVLPAKPKLLLTHAFAHPAVAAFKFKGLHRNVMKFQNASAKTELQLLALEPPSPYLSISDAVHILTITSCSQSSRVFSSPFADHKSEPKPQNFKLPNSS